MVVVAVACRRRHGGDELGDDNLGGEENVVASWETGGTPGRSASFAVCHCVSKARLGS
jgi:hypothetical protein